MRREQEEAARGCFGYGVRYRRAEERFGVSPMLWPSDWWRMMGRELREEHAARESERD